MESETIPVTTSSNSASLDLAARLGGKVRGYRDQLKAATERLAAMEKTAKERETELESLRSRASESAQAKQIDALTAELRGVKHRRVFDKLAADAGVKGPAIDDLWTLSGYKPEADDADEAALQTLIDEQKTARPHLFGEAAPGEPVKPAESLPPGPGASRGAGAKTPQEFTEAQLSDPVFVMKNFDRIAAAAKERTAG